MMPGVKLSTRGARIIVVLLFVLPATVRAQNIVLKGSVVDRQGNALPNVAVRILDRTKIVSETKSGPAGQFLLKLPKAGNYIVQTEAPDFRSVTQPITILSSPNPDLTITMSELASRIESVTVTSKADETSVLSPDPGQQVFVSQDLILANPGRPGAPLSIPGYPIETASGGIKAPQYFAPGVAGDHGEPIAQYLAVGSYLVPNNLSANAHGNGYSDPNIFIPQTLESVQIDGAAYDVREGNHAVNLAATYQTRSHLDPFIAITADYRDLDIVGGFSPSRPSWMAFSGSYGNGFLHRLEHRQQYKWNGERLFDLGAHHITLSGIAYYGVSKVPGLVPIFPTNSNDSNFLNLGDTIDPRQKDQTHTALVAVNDSWQLTGSQQLQLSGFFRTYNLSLYSDFGQGLIRQSEFRTATGGNATYINKLGEHLSVLGGIDYQREAPRRDNLDDYGFVNPGDPNYYGPFVPVSANNLTIAPIGAFFAADGHAGSHFRYYLGWRREEIDFVNRDLLHPGNSFQRWTGVNLPKATLSFLPNDLRFLPLVSLSFGQAYFTNDPRTGSGNTPPTPVNTAHSYQLVASKDIHKTEFRITLGHVTTSQTLAQLDPDTGLQIDQGPGRLRFLTASLHRDFKQFSVLATFSKADARDLMTGLPTPEAPRTMFDVLGTVSQLPWRLQAKGEFEYVAAKPLGTGCLPDPNAECIGIPLKEFRAAVLRPFLDGRLNVGVNALVARGYSGQTLEAFSSSDVSEIAGVRTPSYASLGVSYRFGRSGP